MGLCMKVRGAMLGVLALCLLASCAERQFITIATLYPPRIEVPGEIRNLVVLDLKGPGGPVIAQKVEQALLKNPRFNLVDRAQVSAVLDEQRFRQSGLVEEDAAFLEAMKLRSVDALITGTVSTFEAVSDKGMTTKPVLQQVLVGQRPIMKDGRVIRYDPIYQWRSQQVPVPYQEMRASVLAAYKMVDVKNGRILASDSTAGAYTSGMVTSGVPPPESIALQEATTACVNEFLKQIAPWVETENFPLEKRGGTSAGNFLAKSGLFDKAETAYRSLLERKPSNYHAAYNLGLVLEAQGKLKEAEESYDKALTLRPRSEEAVAAVQRVQGKRAVTGK